MTKKAAFITGNYRNLLHEYGYSQKEIDEKLKKYVEAIILSRSS